MMWKNILLVLVNILLVLVYWALALTIMYPVVYLAECVSPWFWMLTIIAFPLLFVVTAICSAISDEMDEKRRSLKSLK